MTNPVEDRALALRLLETIADPGEDMDVADIRAALVAAGYVAHHVQPMAASIVVMWYSGECDDSLRSVTLPTSGMVRRGGAIDGILWAVRNWLESSHQSPDSGGGDE